MPSNYSGKATIVHSRYVLLLQTSMVILSNRHYGCRLRSVEGSADENDLRCCLRNVYIGRPRTGCVEGKDREGKEANYRLVQQLAEKFVKRNGSLICGELLGVTPSRIGFDPVPEARTPEYYKKRPCLKTVEEAARIWVEYLEKHPNSYKKAVFITDYAKKRPISVI